MTELWGFYQGPGFRIPRTCSRIRHNCYVTEEQGFSEFCRTSFLLPKRLPLPGGIGLIRALIVGNDYPARMELRHLLDRFERLTVMGEAVHPCEALELCRAVRYTVVFLEVSEPELGGCREMVDNLQQLPSPPLLVLVSDSEHLALKAFELGAVDYLLKPLEESRVAKAVARVSGLLHLPSEKLTTVPSEAPLRLRPDPSAGSMDLALIPVERNGKMVLVDPKDVVYAYADDDYVYLRLFKEKFLTHFTLRELESRFEPFHFFRSHRTYLINLRRIKEIVPHPRGSYGVVLDDHDKTEIPVSRAKRRKLKSMLGL